MRPEGGKTVPTAAAGGVAVSGSVGALADGFSRRRRCLNPPEDRAVVFFPGFCTTEEQSGFEMTSVREIVGTHDRTASVTESKSGGAMSEIPTDPGT